MSIFEIFAGANKDKEKEQVSVAKKIGGIETLAIKNTDELFQTLDASNMWASVNKGTLINREEIKRKVRALLSGQTGKAGSFPENIQSEDGKIIPLRSLAEEWIGYPNVRRNREELLNTDSAYLLENSETIQELLYNLDISKTWTSAGASGEWETKILKRKILDAQSDVRNGVDMRTAIQKIPGMVMGKRIEGKGEPIKFRLLERLEYLLTNE